MDPFLQRRRETPIEEQIICEDVFKFSRTTCGLTKVIMEGRRLQRMKEKDMFLETKYQSRCKYDMIALEQSKLDWTIQSYMRL